MITASLRRMFPKAASTHDVLDQQPDMGRGGGSQGAVQSDIMTTARVYRLQPRLEYHELSIILHHDRLTSVRSAHLGRLAFNIGNTHVFQFWNCCGIGKNGR